jgi:hypothetical protein
MSWPEASRLSSRHEFEEGTRHVHKLECALDLLQVPVLDFESDRILRTAVNGSSHFCIMPVFFVPVSTGRNESHIITDWHSIIISAPLPLSFT